PPQGGNEGAIGITLSLCPGERAEGPPPRWGASEAARGDELFPAGPRSKPPMGRAQILHRDHAGLLRVDFREMLARAGEILVLGELAVTVLIERLEQRLAAIERALHLQLARVTHALERALGGRDELVVIDEAVAIGVQAIELRGGEALGVLQRD